jgi:OmpA-OmpF porin, OOP family
MKQIKLILIVAFLMLFIKFSSAQIVIDVPGKIIDKTNSRVNNKVDQGIDKGLDAIENDVENSGKNKDKDKKDKKDKKDESKTETNTNSGDNNNNSNNNTNNNTEKKDDPLVSYSKYDFIPGDKVVFFDDFVQDNLGDFPALWNTTGSAEVKTMNLYPGKWFGMNPNAYFTPEVEIAFGENFTLEFDMIYGIDPDNSWNEAFYIYLIQAETGWKINDNNNSYTYLGIYPETAEISSKFNGDDFASSNPQNHGIMSKDNKFSKPTHISVWCQKQRIRMYIDEKKVFDLPKMLPPDSKFNRIMFQTGGSGQQSLYITNVRVAMGLPDTRNKLLTDGKFVTTGIKFDSGLDQIKPESYGTLKDIAQVLKDNPTVKVKIVGHTDSDGDDASNLSLSKKRAEAVKSSLTKDFGIDASRMETDGKGEKEPVSPNTTTEGKANNRRVEFIKL